MNDRTPISESAACAAVDIALQLYLDGSGIDLVADATEHCAVCPACRGNVRAAIELRRALQLVPPVTAPSALTDRIVNAVCADLATPARPFHTPRALLWVAVAASVLVAGGMLTVRLWPSAIVAPERPAPALALVPPVEVPALRDQFADAGNAIVSLTRRAADQAVEPTRKLRPDRIEPISFDLVGQFPISMDPAAESLQQVRQGAASGFEPVAQSARRAVSMFLDMPPIDRDRKPDF